MTGKTDFHSLLKTPPYSFLYQDRRLKGRVILLGLSGSYGYGTEREGSDIDLRGAALNLPSDLIGLTAFEQFEDRETDTVIYSFNHITVDEVGAMKLVSIGEKVRLEDDLFTGSQGVVTKIDYRKERARVDFVFEGNACHTWVAIEDVRKVVND